MGRRDCSVRRAVARWSVSAWIPLEREKVPWETYSCPASESARLVVRLQIWHQAVGAREGGDLSL